MAARSPLEAAEVKCREIALLLKDVMPPGWRFVLILASEGEGGFMTYMANAQREGAIKLLRELAEKIEKDAKKA